MEEEPQFNFMLLRPHLPDEWRDLGRYLYISEDELLRLSKEYEDRISESIYQMLLDWKMKNGDAATPDKLIDALEKLGRIDLTQQLAGDLSTRQSKGKDWTPDKQLGDSLMFLGRNIGRDWKDFGRYLHISEDKLFHLHKERKDVVAESIYQMFLYWQQKNPDDTATPDKLIEVLERLGRRDLAEKSAGVSTRHSEGKDGTPDKQLGDSLMTVGKVPRSQSEGKYRTSEEELRRCFMFLKWKICEDLNKIANFLDISEKELSLLREEDNYKESIHQLLLYWQRKNGDTATPDKLIEALKTSGRHHLGAEMLADLSTRHSEGKDWTPDKHLGDSLMNVGKVSRSGSEGKYRITEEKLQQYFMFLKHQLYSDWKDFGRFLGISEDELERVCEEYKGDVSESIYQMLLSLQRKNDFVATPDKLIVALMRIYRNDLVEKLADERLDGTSLYAKAFIDKDGGTLFLCDADISLHVPAGALTHGCIIRITVPLNSEVSSSYPEVLPRLTPLTICEPDDLHFQLPVKLTLPHCAVIKNPKNHTVTVKFGRSNVAKEMTWVSEAVEYSLSEHYCSVFLKRFSSVDVGISSTEEKILRVIPYTKLVHDKMPMLSLWLCNDLESDFQKIIQSEEKNGGLPLDSYDTFQLRCVSELENKVKVSLEALEGSNWHPKKNENEATIGAKRLSISNTSKCNFGLVSDGNDDESYMYFLLRVTQTVGDERTETTFALRKRICDLKMPATFRKPFSQNKKTSHLLPTESLRPYTAVVYMDPVKRVNDDVIITVWLSRFDSSTEIFQGLQEEQELQNRQQVDKFNENSFSIVNDKPAVVTKTQFLNGQWLLFPEEMKIETERIRFGSRAKFQFIGKMDKTNKSEFIKLQVEIFQVGEEKMRFLAYVELKQLLYEIRQRNIEELEASVNEDHSNPSNEGVKSYESQINLLPSTSSTVFNRKLEKQGADGNVPPRKIRKSRTPKEQLKGCL